MAGEDSSHPYAAADADPCPLCGAASPGPARVALPKRRLFPPDSSMTTPTPARVGAGDEAAAALREALARQRRAVAGLQAELEAERAAAADAASEAMSMILRLQRDKSEAMMEARQYRRFAEERFAHDAAEAEALRGAVGRRDAAVRALSTRLRECQARLLHLGYDPPSPTAAAGRRAVQDHPHHHAFASDRDDDEEEDAYPPVLDHPALADVGTPRTHHLLNRMPGQDPDPDDDPPFRTSPRSPSPDSFSYDDDGVALADEYPLYSTSDRDAPDQDYDRVYTVDTVHAVPWADGKEDEEEEAELQKLKARLQALEADRESMRHAIMSMGDEKAQVLLLREIAQQLCREGVAVPRKVQPRLQPVVVEQRKVVVKRQPGFVKLFIVTVIKWIVSIFCWRKKSERIKYPIGLCGSNVGLMLVLDRYPKQRHRKFLRK